MRGESAITPFNRRNERKILIHKKFNFDNLLQRVTVGSYKFHDKVINSLPFYLEHKKRKLSEFPFHDTFEHLLSAQNMLRCYLKRRK